jgi:hypothetical protein
MDYWRFSFFKLNGCAEVKQVIPDVLNKLQIGIFSQSTQGTSLLA